MPPDQNPNPNSAGTPDSGTNTSPSDSGSDSDVNFTAAQHDVLQKLGVIGGMQGRELQEGALRTVSSIYWLLDPATSIDPGLGSPPNSIRDAQQLIGGLDNRLAGSTGDKREGVARALTSAATELDRQIQEVTARRNEAAQADSQPPEVAPPPAQPQETGTPWHATALKYGKMPFSLAGKAWDGFTDGFHRGWKGAVIGTFFMPVIGTSVGWYIDQKWVSGKQR